MASVRRFSQCRSTCLNDVFVDSTGVVFVAGVVSWSVVDMKLPFLRVLLFLSCLVLQVAGLPGFLGPNAVVDSGLLVGLLLLKQQLSVLFLTS